MKRTVVGAQGEITIFRVTNDDGSIAQLPVGAIAHTDTDKAGRPIISHSESGHHHVLERPVEVYRAPETAQGMQILYALLDEPTALIQDASDAHGSHMLEPGMYEMRIAREFDPFSEQIRQVAD